MIEQFEAMLARGQDNPLLRFTLGGEWLKAGDAAKAVEHLRQAVHLDPGYSAAWKLYARALAEAGHRAKAIGIYEQGIEVASDKGDIQTAKEMKVFLKRLQKQLGTTPTDPAP